jgi:lysophospholipase L1-like esterase
MRKFSLKAGLLIPLAGSLLLHAADPAPAFRAESRILFQGDSITDGNRGRTADPNHILGHGYAFLIAAKYGAMLPERNMVFLNRGISGNTVANLAARWQADTLDLKPDVLSILIGINDSSRRTPIEEFESAYDRLLAETVAANPNVRLALCEPFTLPVGRYKDPWDEWRADVKQRQAVTAKLAAKYHAVLVEFQRVFDDACKRAPADYWMWDGIHPTYSGHQLMADEWARAVLGVEHGASPKQ